MGESLKLDFQDAARLLAKTVMYEYHKKIDCCFQNSLNFNRWGST